MKLHTVVARRRAAEKRVVRAARRYARAAFTLDEMVAARCALQLAADHLRYADEDWAAWKREARRRLRAAKKKEAKRLAEEAKP